MANTTRLDVGFQGGQVLAVRSSTDAYDSLVAALGDDKSGRWHTLETDDSQILVDLSQIVYLRRDSGNQRVGF